MRLNTTSRVRRAISLIVGVYFLIILTKWLRQGRRAPSQWSKLPPPGVQSNDAFCSKFPDPGTVAIALKTGATEGAEKVPMQLLTCLRCAENVMIFSDLEQTVAGRQFHDALSAIPKSAMEGNPEFDYYWKLKEAQKYGQIERMLRKVRDAEDPDLLASWVLDKYKHLHMWEKLYAAYPDKEWYLMMDADTYLVWPNLLSWIRKIPDPVSTPWYIGSPAFQEVEFSETNFTEVTFRGEVDFAHSGSGILMSQGTMYELAYLNKGTASRWDKPLRELCCGDLMTGIALMELGILLKDAWPTIHGEKPITIPFGPLVWCDPVVTMHHVEPHEMSQLANFEMSRLDIQEPLIFADLYNEFTRDILPDSMENWDTPCEDFTYNITSYEACRRDCEIDPDCFQFKHNGKQCFECESIHLGSPAETVNGTIWRSGWMKQKIDDWVNEQSLCAPKFPYTPGWNVTTGSYANL